MQTKKQMSGVILQTLSLTQCVTVMKKVRINMMWRLNKTYKLTAITMETVQREERPALSLCTSLMLSFFLQTAEEY